jgi:hypothetical protein
MPNQPLFAMQARYQGTFIPQVTTSTWYYALVPVYPSGTVGAGVEANTTATANAGLNGIDIVNVSWSPAVGAIGYRLYRQRDTPPVFIGTPPPPAWAEFTSELGVKDIGFPATTRS